MGITATCRCACDCDCIDSCNKSRKKELMAIDIKATVTNEELAVRCRGLTKTYGAGDRKVMALRGVDLDVRLGELLMLVGPSGCGKTTLISVIAAILNHDSGDCEVLGQKLKDMDQRQRTRFRG